jgi:alpha-L-fucosidase
MGWPEGGKVTIKSLAQGSEHYPGQIAKVELLGSKWPLSVNRDASGLNLTLPEKPSDNEFAYALKITAKT